MEMNMSREHQQIINKYFSQKVLAYQPAIAIVLKSIPAAIMLTQLLHWHTKGKRKDGYIYKTVEEMYSETALTRTMQTHAKKILLEAGFIEFKLADIPAKKHYKVNLVAIQKLLPTLKESCNLKHPNPAIIYDDNLVSITKSTHDKTPKKSKPGGDELIPKEISKEFIEFIEMRKSMRSPLTPRATELIVAKLSGFYPNDFDSQRACLEQSVEHGWKTVYKIKDDSSNDKAIF